MLQFTPNPERASLGFKDAVLANFQFLQEMGFHVVQQDVTFVRFESPKVFVNVYHGRSSYELGVEIGMHGKSTRGIALGEIVAWAGALKTEGFGQHAMFQVSSREGVEQFVPKLAALVRKYGVPFLRGDSDAYREALEERSRAARDYERQAQVEGLRRRAEVAWSSRDFAGAVELYRSIGPDITQVEAKKLAYAEKKVRALS